MGAAAIDALLEGQRNIMIGDDDEKIVYVPFSKAIRHGKEIDRDLLELLKKLST
jgi:6-phosphofructokinase 1